MHSIRSLIVFKSIVDSYLSFVSNQNETRERERNKCRRWKENNPFHFSHFNTLIDQWNIMDEYRRNLIVMLTLICLIIILSISILMIISYFWIGIPRCRQFKKNSPNRIIVKWWWKMNTQLNINTSNNKTIQPVKSTDHV